MGGVGSGARPREYPAEVVSLACGLYLAGLTVREVQGILPRGHKAQTILERHLPMRRSATPRDQTGAANPMWRGGAAGYKALHLRVAQARGKPSKCDRCGTTVGRFEWASLTGHYADVDDYERMCVPCHRAFDFLGRRANGQFMSRWEALGNVS